MKRRDIIPLTLLLAISVSSCKKFVEGYDVDPNQAEKAPLSQKLTAIEVATGLSASGELPRVAGIWTGQFTGVANQYDALEHYITQALDFNVAWGVLYTTIGANAVIIQQEADAVKDPWTKGIAQVLETYAIGTSADLFGDVPYSQAFQPDIHPNPVFDKQLDVYNGVQTKLSDAITNLASPTGGNLSSDFLYSGDLTKWTAAAHSFKARYYLHTSEYQKAIEEATAGISSPANDLMMPFKGTAVGVDINPYFDFSTYSRPGYIDAKGAFAVSLLQSRNTASTNEKGRLNYYYNLEDQNINYTDISDTSGGFGGSNNSSSIISYVETQLILAESYLRLSQPEQALIALNKVRAANANNPKYTLKGNGGVKYDPYGAGDFTSGDALLKEIMTEKYLTLLGQTEVYNDARRKNNAALIGIPLKVNSSPSIPQRLFIPQSEISTNPNTPVQTTSDLFSPTPVNK